MSYIDQWNRSQDSGFQVQVRIAMVTAALAVMAEDPATASHAARVTLAEKILSDPMGMTSRIALAAVTNGAIAAQAAAQTPSPDSDIQFTVNSIFTAEAL
jgi:hypothetical protein